jgi:hypothetical protein
LNLIIVAALVQQWTFFTLDSKYQMDVVGTYATEEECKAAAVEWRKDREQDRLTYHCMLQKPKDGQ